MNDKPSKEPARLLVRLTSGKQLTITRLQLFPEPEYEEIVALQASAQELLGGLSLGVGLIGSPGWVLGGAAALGALESLVSKRAQQKGVEMLRKAALRADRLRTKGQLFEVSLISGVDSPNPASWRARGKALIEFPIGDTGLRRTLKLVTEYDLSKQDITDGVANKVVETGFVHNGEPFIWAEVDARMVAIRWGFVETYELFGSVREDQETRAAAAGEPRPKAPVAESHRIRALIGLLAYLAVLAVIIALLIAS